jgi:hypothetical protein
VRPRLPVKLAALSAARRQSLVPVRFARMPHRTQHRSAAFYQSPLKPGRRPHQSLLVHLGTPAFATFAALEPLRSGMAAIKGREASAPPAKPDAKRQAARPAVTRGREQSVSVRLPAAPAPTFGRVMADVADGADGQVR